MKITRKLFLEASLAMLASMTLTGLSYKEGNAMMQRVVSLRDMVGPNVFQNAGLHKLSENEQMALADWINNYMNQISKSIEEDCLKRQNR